MSYVMEFSDTFNHATHVAFIYGRVYPYALWELFVGYYADFNFKLYTFN